MVKEYKRYRSYGHSFLISALHAIPFPVLILVAAAGGIAMGVR